MSPILWQSSRCARSLRRWEAPLFTLFRTTVLTTGSCVATMRRCSATTPPEKRPGWLPRQSRESMATSSSFTFPTEERPARILQRAGWPDCSGDRTECLDTLSHLDAVDMLARPRQQLRQGHQPRLARNLAAVVYEHQGRYGLDGEALQQFRRRIAVHLDQPHVRLELGCRLFEDRRHRLAGAAPGCPEIDEQRNVTVLCVLVEASGAVQCSRPPFVKRPVAGPAFGPLA